MAVRTALPVGARSLRDRSDAPVGLTRTTNVPARPRNWTPIGVVALNPERDAVVTAQVARTAIDQPVAG